MSGVCVGGGLIQSQMPTLKTDGILNSNLSDQGQCKLVARLENEREEQMYGEKAYWTSLEESEIEKAT